MRRREIRTVTNIKLSAKRKRHSSSKPVDEQDDREFEIVKDHMKKFDAKRWETSMAYKRELNTFAPGIYQPDQSILEKLKPNDIGLFIGDANDAVSVERTKNPDEKGSFGFIGVFAVVLSNSTFIPGTLVLRFDRNRLESVARNTLRLFRWDENLQSFHKVFSSDVSNQSGGDYVWGRITLPGKYAVIGLHSHPLVIRTAKISAILSDLMSGLNTQVRKHLQEKICNLVLHSTELRKAIEEPKVLKALIQGSTEEGFPDPRNAWKPNPGFESPDIPDDICPDLPHLPEKPELPQHIIRLPEAELLPHFNRFEHICFDTGWRNVGPANISGCIFQVIVDPVDDNTIYAAAADGGLWRLTDVISYPTSSWIPLTDQNDSLITRSVAIAASDNNVIYIADGLGYLLRSSDRGLTWKRTNKTNIGLVYKIIVNPLNEDIVFIASNTGLWRSTNGGSTWDSGIVGRTKLPLTYGDITDAVMDPDNPSILYIGVRGSGLWKSSRSGDSWELMLSWSSATSPLGNMIKIAIGRQGSDANRTVAVKFDQEIIVNHRGGRPPSVVGGESWVSKGKWGGSGYGDWAHVIAIDPSNNEVILAGAQDLLRTYDGGESWNKVAGYGTDTHPDQQSIMFDPKRPNRVYLSNDGGVFLSKDGGVTWSDLNTNLVTAQFSNIGVSHDTAVSGMYHQGIVASEHLSTRQWSTIEGGGWEFTNIYGDPIRPDTFYVFAATDLWRRRFPHVGAGTLVTIGSFKPTAIAIDTRMTSNTLLVGSDSPGRIMRALDGDSETPTLIPESGISIGTEPIVSIAFAPSRPGMVYAVSVSGRVFRKSDVNSDEDWEEMGHWDQDNVTQIAVNALHSDRIYLITSDQYLTDRNRVARSADGGKSWVQIPGTGKSSRLPASQFNSILAHRYDGRTILLAADIGVFISRDEGQKWSAFDRDLPNAECQEIFWSEDYIYASTYGRGLWRRKVPCL